MAITLDGTNGITTPDVDSDGLTVDTNTLFVDAENNRVGIGTSSPAYPLDIANSTDGIRLGSDVAGYRIFREPTGGDAGLLQFFGSQSGFNGYIFDGADGERARINSSGHFLVGATDSSTSVPSIYFRPNTASGITVDGDRCFQLSRLTSNGEILQFRKDGTVVGNVSVTGSATSYNTSSDYRLKEDVQPMVGATDRLMALKPVNFAWKVDGSRVDGFLAHEAQEVVPECVTGEKDAVDDEGNPQYQGIDQSKLAPLLVAALQEALTKIEALEARVAALETNA